MFRGPDWTTPGGAEASAPQAQAATAAGLFSMAEIEVNSRCNLHCDYCPVSIAPPLAQARLMQPATVDRIFSELARLGFAGRLSYHFYNEPLLHPGLEGLVEQARERLPRVRQVLYTNGELLSDARHARLIAAGIHRFVITRHTGKPIAERPLQTILEPKELVLTNRGGAMGQAPEPLRLPCHAPYNMLIVTVSGDVLLCYEDYHRTQVMGNILQQPLDEIWFSKRFSELRELLMKGDRTRTEICRACINQAHLSDETFDFVL